MANASDGNLGEQMKKIQQSRNKPAPAAPLQGEDLIERTKSAALSILKAFVEADRDLEIQSSDASGFFVNYGYHHVCRIGIAAAAGDIVRITMDTGQGTSVIVYNAPFREEQIGNSLKAGLLQWYKSLF